MFNSLLETWQNLQKKPRFWILLFFSIISLLILIIPALKSKANTWDVVSQTFFATVLTASLIELSVTTSENYLKESDRRYFRQLFSCGFDTDKSVAIVLPAFNTENPEETENISQDDTSQSTKKELATARSKTAQWVDVITASNLASAFSNTGLPVPQIIRDDEAKDQLNNKDIETFISVGLFSNNFLEINDLNGSEEQAERYFKIIKTGDDDISKLTIRLGDFNNNGLMDEDEWTEVSVKWNISGIQAIGENEYVLFAKIYLPEKNKTVIVLGGCLRDGTQMGGKFITNHLINSSWKNIPEELFQKPSMENIKNRSFAVLYRIPLRDGKINSKNPIFYKLCIPSNGIN